MPDIEDAPDMYEPMPEFDPNDASGDEVDDAVDRMDREVDDIAAKADPKGEGHGPAS